MKSPDKAYQLKINDSLKLILTLITSLFLVLITLEIWVRIFLPQPFSVRFSLQKINTNTVLPLNPAIEKNFNSNEFSIDNQVNHFGFHDSEHTIDRLAGIYRIIILGDSFTYVEQFPLETVWPKQLEKELQIKLNSKIEIINLGLKGAGTGWELAIFKKLGIEYLPDLVILAFDIGSDFFNNHPNLETKFEKPFFKIKDEKVLLVDEKEAEIIVQGVWLPLWQISHLYRYLHRSLYKIDKSFRIVRNGMPTRFEQYLINHPREWQESMAYTESFLREMQTLANKNKCQFIVVIIPDKYQIHNEYWNELKKRWPVMLKKEWDMNAPTKALIAILDRLNVPVIDLTSTFRERASLGDRLYFIKDIHWNLLGNILAARTITEHIAEYIK